MAAEAKDTPARGRLVIRNIGILLTGDIAAPIADADCIVVEDGRIAAVGPGSALDTADPDGEIDVQGGAVCPGLIDSHCHPVFGDWTPRQSQLGWIEMGVNGGVTTLLSAGEVHLPGRPKDAEGVRALAMVAQRCFANFRPAGAKVIAGAPVPELDFDEDFYVGLKQAGIRHIGEIGLGTVAKGPDAARVTGWCRALGIETIMHTGGPSIAGSHFVTCDDVLEAQPDVVSHINGGPTSVAHADVRRLVEQAIGAPEVVHNGNERSALVCLEAVQQAGRLADMLIGTDAPAGSGVQPNGMLRMITLLASLGGLAAEKAFCLATGNVARKRGVEGGMIAPGQPADIVFLDRPDSSSGRDLLQAVSFGDIPGISMVMIDGKPRTGRSRATPPAGSVPAILR